MEENTTPSSSFRPTTPEDLGLISEIERRVHVVPWTEGHFREELSKPYSRFLVLTDDETDSKISGYIVYWELDREYQILNVAVDTEFRGAGLGKKLVRQVIQEGVRTGGKKITLEVRKSNQAAISLYQALSFAITHIRKSFYSNGEDAYQMELSLEDDGIRF